MTCPQYEKTNRCRRSVSPALHFSYTTYFWYPTGCVRLCKPWRTKIVRLGNRRFVYRNICKVTVPAGLAWHVRCESANRYGEYDALTCVFGKFRKIKARILNSRTHKTWYLGFRDTYFRETCHFEENRLFLVETENFWSISDPKR